MLNDVNKPNTVATRDMGPLLYQLSHTLSDHLTALAPHHPGRRVNQLTVRVNGHQGINFHPSFHTILSLADDVWHAILSYYHLPSGISLRSF